jgi:U3 small nucleolar RNA-associated protein 13
VEQLLIEFRRNQDLENYVQLEDYRSAILLALKLDQPRRLLGLFTTVAAKRDAQVSSITGSLAVDEALTTLDTSDTLRLLQHVRAWNASIKSSDVAQSVLHAVLRTRSADEILALGQPVRDGPDFDNDATPVEEEARPPVAAAVAKPSRGVVAELLQALVPYTERHFNRADKMLSQESFLLDYTLSQMLDGFDEDEDVEMAEAGGEAESASDDESVGEESRTAQLAAEDGQKKDRRRAKKRGRSEGDLDSRVGR